MFLLIPGTTEFEKVYFKAFTFHDVSINTENTNVRTVKTGSFTFHDVSINTDFYLLVDVDDIQLYIPRCFY